MITKFNKGNSLPEAVLVLQTYIYCTTLTLYDYFQPYNIKTDTYKN